MYIHTASTNDDFEAATESIPCVEITPKKGRQFLRGPVDWEDTCIVARLPGKALTVWLLIHLRYRLRSGKDEVTLPSRRLIEMGVNHDAKSRALKALRDAGLIRVTGKRGQSPRITLVRS
jgi:hypothetical protein